MHTEIPPDLPPRPLRVLHLTVAFTTGGRRDAIVALAEGGRVHGISPYLASLRQPHQGIGEARHHFDAALQLATDGLPGLRTARILMDFCNNNRIDVLHSHDASSQFAAFLQRIVAPKQRSVMTFHRSLSIDSTGLRAKIRNAVSLAGVDRVVTASEERRQHFLRENLVASRKLAVIPLGVDLGRFRPDKAQQQAIRAELGVGPETPILLSVGHFGPEKGVDQVIRAVAGAASAGDRSPRLVILGRGTPPQEEAIRELAAAQLGERAVFLGFRPDPERWMQGADLLVHAPRLEAFGLAVVQAMACGCPVIATGVGGLPEIVLHETTGLLADPGDADGLANHIERLLGDPERRARMGMAAAERAATEYDVAVCSERYARLYRDLAR